MALEIKYNNSAGRLLAILRAMRTAMDGKSQSKPLLAIYPTLFPGVDATPAADKVNLNSSTIEIHLELNHLIDAVFEECGELCEQNDDYKLFFASLSTLDQLRMRFSPPQQLKPVVEIFTDSVEMALFTFAQALSDLPEIDTDEIASIRQAIDELMTEIEDADIPRTLKVFLFNMQRASRDMLDRYRITGTRGLRAQFHKILGEMADVYRRDDKKDTDRSGVWDQIKQIVSRMDRVVDSAQKYPTIVDKSADAIEAIENMMG